MTHPLKVLMDQLTDTAIAICIDELQELETTAVRPMNSITRDYAGRFAQKSGISMKDAQACVDNAVLRLAAHRWRAGKALTEVAPQNYL